MKQYSKPTIKEMQIALNQTLLNGSIGLDDTPVDPTKPILTRGGRRGAWGDLWNEDEE